MELFIKDKTSQKATNKNGLKYIVLCLMIIICIHGLSSLVYVPHNKWYTIAYIMHLLAENSQEK